MNKSPAWDDRAASAVRSLCDSARPGCVWLILFPPLGRWKRFTSARRASQAATLLCNKSFLLGSLKAGRHKWAQPLLVGLTAGKHRHTCVMRALGTQLMETSQESSRVFRVHMILVAGEIPDPFFYSHHFVWTPLWPGYFKRVEFRHRLLKLTLYACLTC